MSGTPASEAQRIAAHDEAHKASRAIRARVETIIHEDTYTSIADHFHVDDIIETVIERAINNSLALPDVRKRLEECIGTIVNLVGDVEPREDMLNAASEAIDSAALKDERVLSAFEAGIDAVFNRVKYV